MRGAVTKSRNVGDTKTFGCDYEQVPGIPVLLLRRPLASALFNRHGFQIVGS